MAAPRRSPAVPNADGKLALFTVSTYSFESHKKTSEIRVLDIDTGQSTLVTNAQKTSEPNWLEDEILWLKEGEEGSTELIVGDVTGRNYTAAVVPGPISNVKLKVLEKGKVAVAVTAKTTPDGSRMYNPETAPKKLSTGLVYDSLMVRHWDKYTNPNRNSIWYGLFQLSKPHITESKGRYSLSTLVNALQGTSLESPIPPFGDTGHFDLSVSGIAFVAKDPSLNPATHTKCNFYYLPISSFLQSPRAEPRKAQIDLFDGACSSPALSPDGRSAAFTQMKKDGYESDKNRIMLIPDVSKVENATELLKSTDGQGLWDRSPSGLIWSVDGKNLYLHAEEEGKGLLFKVDVPVGQEDVSNLPEKITETGYVSDAHVLAENSTMLFVSSTNLVDNSLYTVVDPAKPSDTKHVSSNSRDGTAFGLAKSQVSDIWFKGSGDYKVHAWVMKPSNFTSGKQYPLAYLIHGGPQGSWGDQWSTRWNPAVFAEQGYVVVAPNPTGSTGYGQQFCDNINNSWGGLPYEDIVNGFEYIKSNMTFVDTDRAVALGASYGGYMMNWMQGHPLGRQMKALVCHDGVFSMANQMSSDEQYFPNHDLGGPYWAAMENWDRWDPSRYIGNWSTPQLVIHNELDYRLPISEGLAAFNILQERGVESRFLTFPDENHWVLKEENSLVWHTVVLNWINRFVGLPPYKGEGEEGFEVQSTKVVAGGRDVDLPSRGSG